MFCHRAITKYGYVWGRERRERPHVQRIERQIKEKNDFFSTVDEYHCPIIER